MLLAGVFVRTHAYYTPEHQHDLRCGHLSYGYGGLIGYGGYGGYGINQGLAYGPPAIASYGYTYGAAQRATQTVPAVANYAVAPAVKYIETKPQIASYIPASPALIQTYSSGPSASSSAANIATVASSYQPAAPVVVKYTSPVTKYTALSPTVTSYASGPVVKITPVTPAVKYSNLSPAVSLYSATPAVKYTSSSSSSLSGQAGLSLAAPTVISVPAPNLYSSGNAVTTQPAVATYSLTPAVNYVPVNPHLKYASVKPTVKYITSAPVQVPSHSLGVDGLAYSSGGASYVSGGGASTSYSSGGGTSYSSAGSLATYPSGGATSYASGGVTYQAVAAPAVLTPSAAVATAPAVLTETAPVYAPSTPALATFISPAPALATPVHAKAVLQPVLKKYHKDHVSD